MAETGVTYPLGFRASGVECGLKAAGGLDLALVVNDGPDQAVSAVFTANRVLAAPLRWCRGCIGQGVARAVVLNSGGANCLTGAVGALTVRRQAELAARLLGALPEQIFVCSTGVIGEYLDEVKVLSGIGAAFSELSTGGSEAAARAIMTTDSRAKLAAYADPSGWRIGGMAKGAGMIAPDLATMLVVITTDARVSSRDLDRALSSTVTKSFSCLDVDGCMSTNDQVTVMASGASCLRPEYSDFARGLRSVCWSLARQIWRDAEGAEHFIRIEVRRACNRSEALEVARAVARSNLFKTAIFGEDANWGRVLAAMGTTRAEFDPEAVDLYFNGIRLCHAGVPDADRDLVDWSLDEVSVVIDLGLARARATVYTTDLTVDYVRENSSYSS